MAPALATDNRQTTAPSSQPEQAQPQLDTVNSNTSICRISEIKENLEKRLEGIENSHIFGAYITEQMQAMLAMQSAVLSYEAGVAAESRLCAERAILEIIESRKRNTRDERDYFSPTERLLICHMICNGTSQEADQALLKAVSKCVDGLDMETSRQLVAKISSAVEGTHATLGQSESSAEQRSELKSEIAKAIEETLKQANQPIDQDKVDKVADDFVNSILAVQAIPDLSQELVELTNLRAEQGKFNELQLDSLAQNIASLMHDYVPQLSRDDFSKLVNDIQQEIEQQEATTLPDIKLIIRQQLDNMMAINLLPDDELVKPMLQHMLGLVFVPEVTKTEIEQVEYLQRPATTFQVETAEQAYQLAQFAAQLQAQLEVHESDDIMQAIHYLQQQFPQDLLRDNPQLVEQGVSVAGLRESMEHSFKQVTEPVNKIKFGVTLSSSAELLGQAPARQLDKIELLCEQLSAVHINQPVDKQQLRSQLAELTGAEIIKLEVALGHKQPQANMDELFKRVGGEDLQDFITANKNLNDPALASAILLNWSLIDGVGPQEVVAVLDAVGTELATQTLQIFNQRYPGQLETWLTNNPGLTTSELARLKPVSVDALSPSATYLDATVNSEQRQQARLMLEQHVQNLVIELAREQAPVGLFEGQDILKHLGDSTKSIINTARAQTKVQDPIILAPLEAQMVEWFAVECSKLQDRLVQEVNHQLDQIWQEHQPDFSNEEGIKAAIEHAREKLQEHFGREISVDQQLFTTIVESVELVRERQYQLVESEFLNEVAQLARTASLARLSDVPWDGLKELEQAISVYQENAKVLDKDEAQINSCIEHARNDFNLAQMENSQVTLAALKLEIRQNSNLIVNSLNENALTKISEELGFKSELFNFDAFQSFFHQAAEQSYTPMNSAALTQIKIEADRLVNQFIKTGNFSDTDFLQLHEQLNTLVVELDVHSQVGSEYTEQLVQSLEYQLFQVNITWDKLNDESGLSQQEFLESLAIILPSDHGRLLFNGLCQKSGDNWLSERLRYHGIDEVDGLFECLNIPTLQEAGEQIRESANNTNDQEFITCFVQILQSRAALEGYANLDEYIANMAADDLLVILDKVPENQLARLLSVAKHTQVLSATTSERINLLFNKAFLFSKIEQSMQKLDTTEGMQFFIELAQGHYGSFSQINREYFDHKSQNVTLIDRLIDSQRQGKISAADFASLEAIIAGDEIALHAITLVQLSSGSGQSERTETQALELLRAWPDIDPDVRLELLKKVSELSGSLVEYSDLIKLANIPELEKIELLARVDGNYARAYAARLYASIVNLQSTDKANPLVIKDMLTLLNNIQLESNQPEIHEPNFLSSIQSEFESLSRSTISDQIDQLVEQGLLHVHQARLCNHFLGESQTTGTDDFVFLNDLGLYGRGLIDCDLRAVQAAFFGLSDEEREYRVAQLVLWCDDPEVAGNEYRKLTMSGDSHSPLISLLMYKSSHAVANNEENLQLLRQKAQALQSILKGQSVEPTVLMALSQQIVPESLEYTEDRGVEDQLGGSAKDLARYIEQLFEPVKTPSVTDHIWNAITRQGVEQAIRLQVQTEKRNELAGNIKRLLSARPDESIWEWQLRVHQIIQKSDQLLQTKNSDWSFDKYISTCSSQQQAEFRAMLSADQDMLAAYQFKAIADSYSSATPEVITAYVNLSPKARELTLALLEKKGLEQIISGSWRSRYALDMELCRRIDRREFTEVDLLQIHMMLLDFESVETMFFNKTAQQRQQLEQDYLKIYGNKFEGNRKNSLNEAFDAYFDSTVALRLKWALERGAPTTVDESVERFRQIADFMRSNAVYNAVSDPFLSSDNQLRTMRDKVDKEYAALTVARENNDPDASAITEELLLTIQRGDWAIENYRAGQSTFNEGAITVFQVGTTVVVTFATAGGGLVVMSFTAASAAAASKLAGRLAFNGKLNLDDFKEAGQDAAITLGTTYAVGRVFHFLKSLKAVDADNVALVKTPKPAGPSSTAPKNSLAPKSGGLPDQGKIIIEKNGKLYERSIEKFYKAKDGSGKWYPADGAPKGVELDKTRYITSPVTKPLPARSFSPGGGGSPVTPPSVPPAVPIRSSPIPQLTTDAQPSDLGAGGRFSIKRDQQTPLQQESDLNTQELILGLDSKSKLTLTIDSKLLEVLDKQKPGYVDSIDLTIREKVNAGNTVEVVIEGGKLTETTVYQNSVPPNVENTTAQAHTVPTPQTTVSSDTQKTQEAIVETLAKLDDTSSNPIEDNKNNEPVTLAKVDDGSSKPNTDGKDNEGPDFRPPPYFGGSSSSFADYSPSRPGDGFDGPKDPPSYGPDGAARPEQSHEQDDKIIFRPPNDVIIKDDKWVVRQSAAPKKKSTDDKSIYSLNPTVVIVPPNANLSASNKLVSSETKAEKNTIGLGGLGVGIAMANNTANGNSYTAFIANQNRNKQPSGIATGHNNSNATMQASTVANASSLSEVSGVQVSNSNIIANGLSTQIGTSQGNSYTHAAASEQQAQSEAIKASNSSSLSHSIGTALSELPQSDRSALQAANAALTPASQRNSNARNNGVKTSEKHLATVALESANEVKVAKSNSNKTSSEGLINKAFEANTDSAANVVAAKNNENWNTPNNTKSSKFVGEATLAKNSSKALKAELGESEESEIAANHKHTALSSNNPKDLKISNGYDIETQASKPIAERLAELEAQGLNAEQQALINAIKQGEISDPQVVAKLLAEIEKEKQHELAANNQQNAAEYVIDAADMDALKAAQGQLVDEQKSLMHRRRILAAQKGQRLDEFGDVIEEEIEELQDEHALMEANAIAIAQEVSEEAQKLQNGSSDDTGDNANGKRRVAIKRKLSPEQQLALLRRLIFAYLQMIMSAKNKKAVIWELIERYGFAIDLELLEQLNLEELLADEFEGQLDNPGLEVAQQNSKVALLRESAKQKNSEKPKKAAKSQKISSNGHKTRAELYRAAKNKLNENEVAPVKVNSKPETKADLYRKLKEGKEVQ